VDAVLGLVEQWLPLAEGFTISGGEPFDQPQALHSLLTALRSQHSGDVLVYSGHPFEALPLHQFDGLIDALISDPLRIDYAQTLPLRGSDNQRLQFLTDLGRSRFGYAVAPNDEPHRLDVMFDEASGDAFLAGIPRRGDLVRLRHILEQAGHSAGITEDVRQQP
jgi:anaerobic ribonucleoside-triphosphate reductase activating protein